MEKLRKAMEKAKGAQDGIISRPGAPSRSRSKPEEGDGRVSPKYSQSRSVRVDPRRLMANRCVAVSPDSPDVESYKVLRAQILQRTRDQGLNTVMITSAIPGEGKTLSTVNLALTFAREFSHTVLLVDCDFKQQRIHELFGIRSNAGLIDYLDGDRQLQELIIWPGIEKLTLISGGRTVHESSELLGSSRMRALVQEMKTRYADRYIFFDVPPVLSGADALSFAHLVDGIIMVVQASRTSISDVKKAVELLPGEKFLGFVLNRRKTPSKSYERYYYRSRKPRRTRPA